jgi:hypothetical protein
MTDRDVTAAVRTAAFDYGWAPFHEGPNIHYYAQRHYELRVYFAPNGAVEKAEKFRYPEGVDVADTYQLHGKLLAIGELFNTQFRLVPTLRLFEGSL